jgi:hypothetical protein
MLFWYLIMYLDLNLKVSMVGFYNVDWKFPFIIFKLFKDGKKRTKLECCQSCCTSFGSMLVTKLREHLSFTSKCKSKTQWMYYINTCISKQLNAPYPTLVQCSSIKINLILALDLNFGRVHIVNLN